MIWTHVSELAIDRLLAGEMAPADAAAIRDHAAGCGRCAALLDDALAVRRAFVIDRPPLGALVAVAADPPVLHRVVPLRQRPAAIAGIATLAAAAVLAGVLAWPRGAAPEVRTKGKALVGFFVAHGDEVRRGAAEERVAPGDRVELATTTFAPAWFAAVSVDAGGARTVYVSPRPIEAGRDRVLPLSIELDAAPGAETVHGVFCLAPFDPIALDLADPPPGCTVDRFILVKETR